MIFAEAAHAQTSTPPADGTPAPRPVLTPEQAALRDQLTAYMKRPNVSAAVQEVIRQQASLVPGVCNGMKFRPTGTTIVQKPDFDAEGAMRAGNFRQSFTGEGCGTRKPIINIWFAAETNGTPALQASFPGTSVADPRLQADFAKVAIANAALAIPDCKSFQIADTRFAGFEGTSPTAAKGRDARMWKEEWLLRGCDKAAVVVMHFQPDATGTAGKTSRTETRVLTPSAPPAPGAIPPAGSGKP